MHGGLAVPEAGGFADSSRIARAQFATPEGADGAFHPAEEMDAVGDMADGHFIDFFARIERLPHLPADAPMEFTHAVGGSRRLQGEDGHAEGVLGALWIHAAHGHQFILRYAKLRSISAKGVFHQRGTKAIVACFN